MAIVTIQQIRDHLGLSDGVATEDDALLGLFLDGAQGLVEAELGYAIAARYPSSVPAALSVAVLQIAATWFANRESAVPETLQDVPFAARAILCAYRDRSF
ncbi:MAG: head-tail connector protein [Amaricoccus sp.]